MAGFGFSIDGLELNVPSGFLLNIFGIRSPSHSDVTLRTGPIRMQGIISPELMVGFPAMSRALLHSSTYPFPLLGIEEVLGGPQRRRSTQSSGQDQRRRFRYPAFKLYRERLQSLRNSDWTRLEQQMLAEEGFFSERHGDDQATCFCCGLVVDTVGRTNFRTHHVAARNECEFYQHMTGGGLQSTCFDRQGRNGWTPCGQDGCQLCQWDSRI